MAGEIALVSRDLTMRQACGTKLTIEQSAAMAPAAVIQFIGMACMLGERN
ncbi:hypothetical protein [Bosea sp. FBZP-16]|nr:hypothetical protein [Bosea sp. FBZP-16]